MPVGIASIQPLQRREGAFVVAGFDAPAGHHVGKLGREIGAFAQNACGS